VALLLASSVLLSLNYGMETGNNSVVMQKLCAGAERDLFRKFTDTSQSEGGIYIQQFLPQKKMK